MILIPKNFYDSWGFVFIVFSQKFNIFNINKVLFNLKFYKHGIFGEDKDSPVLKGFKTLAILVLAFVSIYFYWQIYLEQNNWEILSQKRFIYSTLGIAFLLSICSHFLFTNIKSTLLNLLISMLIMGSFATKTLFYLMNLEKFQALNNWLLPAIAQQ